jgi:hypothetical protein
LGEREGIISLGELRMIIIVFALFTTREERGKR